MDEPSTPKRRNRSMTDKGSDYIRERKEKEVTRQIKSLDSKTVSLKALICDNESNYQDVKAVYADWVDNYEQLFEANDKYQTHLNQTNQEDDNEVFKIKFNTYKDIKSSAEQWFLKNTNIHSSVDKSDCISVRSRASSAGSSVTSSISIAKMKESQKRAELVARASALQRQKKLEEEKLALKMKEQELEIQTELQISDARAKVIEDMEKCITQDEMFGNSNKNDSTNAKPVESQTCIQRQSGLNLNITECSIEQPVKFSVNEVQNVSQNNVIQPILSQPHITTSPAMVQTTTSNSNSDLFAVSRELNKPKAEIQNFHGDPMDYNRFLRQFNTRVCVNTNSYEERLNFLMQFTVGEAHKIASGFSHLDAERGYKATLEEFKDRYGDPDVIARAYIRKALDWPAIRHDKAQDLDNFGIFLRECQFAVENIQAMNVLEYSENIRQLVQKLPYYLHDRWRNIVFDIKGKKQTVKFEHLVTFVRNEAKKATDPVYGRETMQNNRSTSQNTQNKQSSESRSRRQSDTYKTLANVVTGNNSEEETGYIEHMKMCPYCAGLHALESCEGLKGLTLKDRYTFLKSKGLCFACLKSGHTKGSCTNKLTCDQCGKWHPSLLHTELRKNESFTSTANFRSHGNTVHATTTSTNTGAGDKMCQALPILPVKIKLKGTDRYMETYAFLDSGSTATFCSEKIAEAMKVVGKRTQINLLTMGQETVKKVYEISGLEIASLDGRHTIELPTVYTQPDLPVSERDVISVDDLQQWSNLKDLPLQRINGQVGLLIGVNVPKAMEPWEVIPSVNGGPFGVKTALGWVINGPLDITQGEPHRYITSNFIKHNSLPSLDEQVQNHFNHDFNEKTIDDKDEHSVEDKQFMKIVQESVTIENGHYTIDLPFRSENVHMPNNRKQAVQRLNLLAKRLQRDECFHREYCDFMDKVIDKGYAEIVPRGNLQQDDGRVWYLPHHGVFHPKKNKLRVVFDCAARYQGTSLNSQLLQGPNLTNSLVGTLLKFRQEEVAIMGDIESMFYQVRVPTKDRGFQRFLWWKDGDPFKPLIEYQMTVHLFGATSSPSCANFALKKVATDCVELFDDEVRNTVLKNFYVDDCLKSVKTVDKAIAIVQDLKDILKHGGFNIAKWISNSRELMRTIPVADRAKEIMNLDLDREDLPIERALGLNWCVESDALCFNIVIKDQPLTRRGILSMVSSVYDPLGFLAPIMLNAKILLQELCRLQLSWDESIPEKYSERWRNLLSDIQKISKFKVNRCFKPQGFSEVKSAELHHFSDASENGYGVVSYLRLINRENKVHCSFVMGKSRVTPLKKVTVPRLELTAATVAARMDKMLKSELGMNIDRTAFWTDSMSVLRYIRNTTSRFQTFVANRITVIQEASNVNDWHYVNTKLNPADLASRGISVDVNLWEKQWIRAPDFLWTAEESFAATAPPNFDLADGDPEVKQMKVNCASINRADGEMVHENDVIEKFIHHYSSWYKLRKGMAWILKVRKELLRRARSKTPTEENCKSNISTLISAEDMEEAEREILSFVQRREFADELNTIINDTGPVKRNSSIRKLDPVLNNGLLRVGGRLHASSLPEESKHPVILPKGHYVSTLLLRQIHIDLKHIGRNHMLSHLRQRFWLINAPSAIRKIISKCVTCRRLKSQVREQKMSNLPEDRLKPDEPPFTRVGVDYFGPFEVKIKRSRVKRYGVIFTCLASRAVHIEVAHSLDTSSCINALRRFVARRGQVTKMWSDNGTNFVGAESEIRKSINEWNVSQIHEAMLRKNIDWQFNPPAGSHHGGVWERLIRSVRAAMNSTLREQVLDDESLSTLMCEIEAVLNDRPITKSSDQHGDLEALTPNHLLTLKKVPNLPPGLFVKTDNYARRRWRQIQYMSSLFWRRWLREYLPLLQERQKWHITRTNISVGDVVLVADPNMPRNSWQMGIVEETMPDSHGLVRQAKIKTASNVVIRPIDKLCLLLEME